MNVVLPIILSIAAHAGPPATGATHNPPSAIRGPQSAVRVAEAPTPIVDLGSSVFDLRSSIFDLRSSVFPLPSPLAQSQPDPGQQPGQQQPGQPQPGGGMFLFPALLMAMLVFFILSSWSQRKRERREREQMFAALKRNDRVLTVGGVVGTVLSVKDNEVVLKVDESTNTKMTFVKSAIQRILSEEGAPQEKK